MDQKAPDQGWQQLQAHIEGFLGQSLKGDTRRIEYKPRFIAQLPDMRPECRQNERKAMTT